MISQMCQIKSRDLGQSITKHLIKKNKIKKNEWISLAATIIIIT